MTATSPTTPQCRYTQEVRLAIVMYGGVSLAIYINGVAQELYHLVRATAPADPKSPDQPLLLNAELTGTERVYRKLGQMLTGQQTPLMDVQDADPIRTRFIIDVLSGTSAGGINAIFLAKALANNQPLDGLKELWVNEGDISLLLNDKHSVKGEPLLSLQDPPSSLLNSKRMYLKLLRAFDAMEAGGTIECSPYGNEVDLFVTATDINGVTVPLRLADNIVYERRHKNVFHFRYYATPHGDPSRTDFALSNVNRQAYIRNDFVREFNPFLAFAARCTSSFPFAFEPMRLQDIDEFVRQIEPYNRGDLSSQSTLWDRFIENYRTSQRGASIPFQSRSFGDGGYLDNKPFSYAIDALIDRQANLPMDRKLIYIEPAPQHPEDMPERSSRPDALENVTAAVLTLPRYETIREDLQRVLQRNELVERIMRITRGIEDDVRVVKKRVKLKKGIEWANQDLAEMIRQKGIGYGGYQRLKVGAVTDELAELLARAAGLDENSDHYLGIRYIVRAWRSRNYTVYYAPGKPKDKQLTENRFLLDFDLGYRIRRLTFVQGKLDILYGGGSSADHILTSIGVQFDMSGSEADLFREHLVAIRRRLNEAFSVLHAAYDALLARLDKNPMHQYVTAIGISGEQLEGILGWNEDERLGMARTIVSDPDMQQRMTALANALGDYVKKASNTASAICVETLKPAKGEGKSPQAMAKECLWHYYQYYDDYDLVMFPALYSTAAGELDTVEIIRISPEDAQSLIDERAERMKPDGRAKLAGTALANFGAFLETLWRKNDILWGRLDGADRLISAMLPGTGQGALRSQLIAEAHTAILEEDLRPQDRLEIAGVLADILLKTDSGEPGEATLRRLLEGTYGSSLDSKTQAVLRFLLNQDQMLEFFRTGYSINRKPDPESTVKILSRASTIIGKILEGITEKRSMNKSSVAWIARVGQIFWSLVIVAVPESLLNLIFKHWLKVLYTFEALLLIFGTVLTISPMQQLAVTMLGITIGVHVLVRLLTDYMRGKKTVLRFILVLLVLSLLILAALGVDTLFGHPVLTWLKDRYQDVMKWWNR